MQDNTILTMTDIVKTYHMGDEEQVILKKSALLFTKGNSFPFSARPVRGNPL